MKQRFMALDGLRGVAALLVAAFHTRTAFQIDPIAHGYLAVDFFFMLSGLVVAHAYEDQLRNGMSFRRFAVARVVRAHKDIFDLLAVFVVFPIIVVAGVSTSAEGALWQWSGRISYPLYLIHAPMLVFFALAVAGRSPTEREAASLLALLIYVVVAAIVVKYYDEPVRFFLGNWTRAPSSMRVEDRSLATPS